jgi:hypothetical protein
MVNVWVFLFLHHGAGIGLPYSVWQHSACPEVIGHRSCAIPCRWSEFKAHASMLQCFNVSRLDPQQCSSAIFSPPPPVFCCAPTLTHSHSLTHSLPCTHTHFAQPRASSQQPAASSQQRPFFSYVGSVSVCLCDPPKTSSPLYLPCPALPSHLSPLTGRPGEKIPAPADHDSFYSCALRFIVSLGKG